MILGVTALAKELGVSRWTIYRYIHKGMKHYGEDGKLIFDLEEVKEWLKNG